MFFAHWVQQAPLGYNLYTRIQLPGVAEGCSSACWFCRDLFSLVGSKMAYSTRFASMKGVQANGLRQCKGNSHSMQLTGCKDLSGLRSVTSSAIVTAAFSAPVVSKSRVARCVVRAQAADQSDALELNRRAVLGAGAAIGAASVFPFAAPQPALANKVLSSDWELVSEPASGTGNGFYRSLQQADCISCRQV